MAQLLLLRGRHFGQTLSEIHSGTACGAWKGAEMKSLITRFASIGMILSLVLAGSSATLAQYVVSPSLHIHRGAISFFPFANQVLAKVTASCTGGTGTVTVIVDQKAAQSNANRDATG